jgi:hypothetical protein
LIITLIAHMPVRALAAAIHSQVSPALAVVVASRLKALDRMARAQIGQITFLASGTLAGVVDVTLVDTREGDLA